MRAAKTRVVVPAVVLLAVVGGWGVRRGIEHERRSLGAILALERLPRPDRVASGLPAAVGFAIANDSLVVELARRQLPDWIDDLKPLGAGKLADVVGLTLLGGGILHADRRAVVGGLTLLEGNVLAGVAVDLGKDGFGRVRPNHPGPGRWFAGGDSFPSSHSTHAFLMASVLDATFDDPGMREAVRLLAAGVALQRLHEGVHYPTDVLAGRALGELVGYRLARANGLSSSRPNAGPSGP